MHHYIVLLNNSTIELAPRIEDLDRDGCITVLPEEPKSVKDGTVLRTCIEDIISDVVRSERRKLEASLKEDEARGIAADIAPPPDWLIALGIWLFGAICGGATWDAIKFAAVSLAKSIQKREKSAASEEYQELSELELERIAKAYLGKDFSKEETLHALYEHIKEFCVARGHEFEPEKAEREKARQIIAYRAQYLEDLQERRETEARERDEARVRVIKSLIENDAEGSSDESEVKNLCKLIDIYLLNGIETQFLRPVLPQVSDAIIKIVEETEIPEEVMQKFVRFNILSTSHELTDFGKSIFENLARVRPAYLSRGRLPKSTFD